MAVILDSEWNSLFGGMAIGMMSGNGELNLNSV